MKWWSGNFIELRFRSLTDAQSISHPGRCDDDVRALSQNSYYARQLDRIDPEKLRLELEEYGAWDSDELSDHEQNCQRILWLAAGALRAENP